MYYSLMLNQEVPVKHSHPTGLTRFLNVKPSTHSLALSKRHGEQVVVVHKVFAYQGIDLYLVRSLKDDTTWEVFDFELMLTKA